MNERVHRYLDGELPYDALTDAERAEVAALEAAIRGGVAAVRPDACPDLATGVMRRLEQLGIEPAPARGGVLGRAFVAVWRPRTVRMRPVYALAAAALAALLVVDTRSDVTTAPPGPAPIAALAPAPVFVQFRVQLGEAQRVALAGSFTDWQPRHELHQVAPGVWTVIVPLAPGVHDYAFIIDGVRWVADPHAPNVDDGFGGVNSRLTLLLPPSRL